MALWIPPATALEPSARPSLSSSSASNRSSLRTIVQLKPLVSFDRVLHSRNSVMSTIRRKAFHALAAPKMNETAGSSEKHKKRWYHSMSSRNSSRKHFTSEDSVTGPAQIPRVKKAPIRFIPSFRKRDSRNLQDAIQPGSPSIDNDPEGDMQSLEAQLTEKWKRLDIPSLSPLLGRQSTFRLGVEKAIRDKVDDKFRIPDSIYTRSQSSATTLDSAATKTRLKNCRSPQSLSEVSVVIRIASSACGSEVCLLPQRVVSERAHLRESADNLLLQLQPLPRAKGSETPFVFPCRCSAWAAEDEGSASSDKSSHGSLSSSPAGCDRPKSGHQTGPGGPRRPVAAERAPSDEPAAYWETDCIEHVLGLIQEQFPALQPPFLAVQRQDRDSCADFLEQTALRLAASMTKDGLGRPLLSPGLWGNLKRRPFKEDSVGEWSNWDHISQITDEDGCQSGSTTHAVAVAAAVDRFSGGRVIRGCTRRSSTGSLEFTPTDDDDEMETSATDLDLARRFGALL